MSPAFNTLQPYGVLNIATQSNTQLKNLHFLHRTATHIDTNEC